MERGAGTLQGQLNSTSMQISLNEVCAPELHSPALGCTQKITQQRDNRSLSPCTLDEINTNRKKRKILDYEMVEGKPYPGNWRVEAINYKSDGEINQRHSNSGTDEFRARAV